MASAIVTGVIASAAVGYVAKGVVLATLGAPTSIGALVVTSAATYGVKFALSKLLKSQQSGRPLYVYKLQNVAPAGGNSYLSPIGMALNTTWKAGAAALEGACILLLLTVGVGGKLIYRIVNTASNNLIATGNNTHLLEDLTEWEIVDEGTPLDIRITDREYDSEELDDWLSDSNIQEMLSDWCILKSDITSSLDEFDGWEHVGKEDENVVQDGEYLNGAEDPMTQSTFFSECVDERNQKLNAANAGSNNMTRSYVLHSPQNPNEEQLNIVGIDWKSVQLEEDTQQQAS